jgi:hypothetical protein
MMRNVFEGCSCQTSRFFTRDSAQNTSDQTFHKYRVHGALRLRNQRVGLLSFLRLVNFDFRTVLQVLISGCVAQGQRRIRRNHCLGVETKVQTNDAIRATLSLLCADREAAELPVSDFVGLEQHTLKSRLAALFESRHLPIVEIKANLHVDSEGEQLHEVDIYGMFNPKCSKRIYLNSALVKTAMRSGSNSL